VNRGIIESRDVCSMVLAEVVRIWWESQEGDTVVIKTPWKSSIQEVKKWCEETGNIVESFQSERGTYSITVKFRAPRS